jgi:hypothetical protein
MKTETELNGDILKIISVIKQRWPELLKYFNEMPVTIPNASIPEINARALSDYYNSLKVVVDNYVLSHKHERK